MMMKKSIINLWCLLAIFSELSILRGDQGGGSYIPGGFWHYYCPNNATSTGTFTSGSTYEANLEDVIRGFKSNSAGFHNLSSGLEPADRVYAIGLCRGDASDTDCNDCFAKAPGMLKRFCGTSKDGIGWQENCMVRYSDRSNIFGTVETDPSYSFCNPEPVPPGVDPSQFNQTRKKLLDKLMGQAASGNSTLKLAIGNYVNETQQQLVLYGIVQCTPDLDKKQCQSCLGDAISTMAQNCTATNSRGGRVYFPSCNLRYENNSFTGTDYNPPGPGYSSSSSSSTTSIPAPPPPPSNESGKGSSADHETKNIVVIIIVVLVATSLVLLLVLVVAAVLFLRTKRKASDHQKLILQNTENDTNMIESLRYDFATIRAATKDFHYTNFLGRGGYGAVYKGVVPNGREIAVKRLERNFGKTNEADFKNEVLLVSKLQHRNLVRLLGFSIQGQQKLVITEYLQNGSLGRYLPAAMGACASLNWQTRFKIILGVARGLLYLHEDSRVRIIHRDLKPDNVLLDQDFNPKIADFGTARLFTKDQTHGDTNNVAGTCGYMAPEYALRGNFSIKSDVYSFGILLLEIVLGRRSTSLYDDRLDVLTMAWRKFNDGETIIEVVDPVLLQEEAALRPEILRCIHIGFLCVQEQVSDRPTMSSVVLMLSGQFPSLPVPSPPPHIGSIIHTETETETSTR